MFIGVDLVYLIYIETSSVFIHKSPLRFDDYLNLFSIGLCAYIIIMFFINKRRDKKLNDKINKLINTETGYMDVRLFILDDHETKRVYSIEEYLNFKRKEKGETIVKETTLPDGLEVSTLFLGLNVITPIGSEGIFLTGVKRSGHTIPDSIIHSQTWDEALAAHQQAIERVFVVS